MQERGGHLVFGRTVIECDGGDGKYVGDRECVGSFPHLLGMEACGERQRVRERDR
jgi:hypothetical protein